MAWVTVFHNETCKFVKSPRGKYADQVATASKEVAATETTSQVFIVPFGTIVAGTWHQKPNDGTDRGYQRRVALRIREQLERSLCHE